MRWFGRTIDNYSLIDNTKVRLLDALLEQNYSILRLNNTIVRPLNMFLATLLNKIESARTAARFSPRNLVTNDLLRDDTKYCSLSESLLDCVFMLKARLNGFNICFNIRLTLKRSKTLNDMLCRRLNNMRMLHRYATMVFSVFHGSGTTGGLRNKIVPPCACSTRSNPKSSRPSDMMFPLQHYEFFYGKILKEPMPLQQIFLKNFRSSSVKTQGEVE